MVAALLLLPLAVVSPLQAKTRPAALKILSIEGGELRGRGRTLRVGQTLPAGVSVQLTGGAKAVLEAGTGGKLLLRGPATFTARARGDSGLDLSAGGALAVLHGLQGRPFSIGTPSAVANVRGTAFFIEARGRQNSYVCVCDGKVELLGRGGRLKTPLASNREHKAFLFNFAGGAGVQSSASIEGHGDADISELK